MTASALALSQGSVVCNQRNNEHVNLRIRKFVLFFHLKKSLDRAESFELYWKTSSLFARISNSKQRNIRSFVKRGFSTGIVVARVVRRGTSSSEGNEILWLSLFPSPSSFVISIIPEKSIIALSSRCLRKSRVPRNRERGTRRARGRSAYHAFRFSRAVLVCLALCRLVALVHSPGQPSPRETLFFSLSLSLIRQALDPLALRISIPLCSRMNPH